MNYIYDILVNFNDKYYEFYDWNESDNILHVKKLPIIRVKSNFLHNIKYNNIVVDKKLIEKIYKKTDFFNNKSNKLNYVCAVSDAKEAIVIKFSPNGTIIGRSSLLIDEENEIIDISENLEENNYDYKINNIITPYKFKTRKEIEISTYIISELNNINEDKLKYLYFDCFDKEETDTKIILKNFLSEINNNFNNVYSKIYDFLKMTSPNS